MKIHITIEADGKVESYTEVDKLVLITQVGDDISLHQKASLIETIGLLKIAEKHINRIWETANQK